MHVVFIHCYVHFQHTYRNPPCEINQAILLLSLSEVISSKPPQNNELICEEQFYIPLS